MYKILIKNKASKTYSYYTQKIGTEETEYETEYLQELCKTYKSLLAEFTTEQIRLVHELVPDIVINLEDEKQKPEESSHEGEPVA